MRSGESRRDGGLNDVLRLDHVDDVLELERNYEASGLAWGVATRRDADPSWHEGVEIDFLLMPALCSRMRCLGRSMGRANSGSSRPIIRLVVPAAFM